MPTAYTYARFSSDRQHESSIEAQQDATRRWAEAHGVTIVHEYADRAISGTTDNRPAFQDMIAACRIRKVDYVLVHKHDRFARNRYDAAIYGRIIEQTGARLIAVAQDFGDTPEAVIMEGLMQAWAEYYTRNLRTEILKGKHVRAQKGLHQGGDPGFGYRVSEDRTTLEIVPEEAAWLRRFYDAYLSGESLTALAHEAERAGIRGRRGRPLHRDGILLMLRNETYAGVYVNKVNGETYRIENHHPAIVSAEIWKEANRRMEAKLTSHRQEEERTYLLMGLCQCGICGGHLRGHTQVHSGKEYPSYFCDGARHPKNGVRLRSIRAEVLDQAARDYIKNLLTPEAREEAARALAEYTRGRSEDAERRRPDAEKRIRALERKIDALVQNMSSDVLPPSVLKRMGDQIAAMETEIEAQRQILSAPKPPAPPDLADFFANAAAIDENTPIEQAQQIVRRFISKITITNDEIIIDSTFARWLESKGVYINPDCHSSHFVFGIKIFRRKPDAERKGIDINRIAYSMLHKSHQKLKKISINQNFTHD